MSDEWRGSFDAFYLDMGDCPKGMSIERKDNTLGYSKENCIWATQTEQSNNRRDNVKIAWRGEIKTMAQWSKELGVRYHTLSARILRLGFSVDEAFTRPVRPIARRNK